MTTPNEICKWLESVVEMSRHDAYKVSSTYLTDAIKCIRNQEARITELTKDAERYQWLRKQHDIFNPLARVVWWKQPTGMLTFTWVETVNSQNLDESIDAAKEQL